MSGKIVRMRRIVSPLTGRSLLLPLDHGFSQGVLPGLENVRRVAELASQNGVDAIVVHKGILKTLLRHGEPFRLGRLGIVVHLSGATSMSPDPLHKTLVCSVDEAADLGADAVSVHVNFSCGAERDMIRDLAEVGRHAERHGIPLLVMVYVRNDASVESVEPRDVLHAARVAEELGADLVKISYPGAAGLEAITRAVGPPVLVAGGAKQSEAKLCDLVASSIAAGAAGVAIGRNIFQAKDPSALLARLRSLVHEVDVRSDAHGASAIRSH